MLSVATRTHITRGGCHKRSFGSVSDGNHCILFRDPMLGPELAVDSQDGDVVLVLPKYAAVLRRVGNDTLRE